MMNDLSVHVQGNYAYVGFGGQAQTTAYATYSEGCVQYRPAIGNLLLGGRYAYTGFDLVQSQGKTRIAIDPNLRVRGNSTYAGFEDVEGPIAVNDPVEVYEPESGLAGEGKITEIDAERKLVYLSVDWSSLGESPAPSPASQASGGVVYFSDDVLLVGHEEWTSLLVTPCLAYVGIGKMSLTLTGPSRLEWNSIFPDLPSSFAPHMEISQPYTDLWSGKVAA